MTELPFLGCHPFQASLSEDWSLFHVMVLTAAFQKHATCGHPIYVLRIIVPTLKV